MKEDIEIIIQDFKDLICLFRHTDNITINKRSAVLFRKTLNLLTRYKEMEADNKRLKDKETEKFLKILDDTSKATLVQETIKLRTQVKDSIPKSKVKEKIEEIEQEDLEIYDTDSEDLVVAKYEYRAVLDALQELLREER